MEGVETGRTHKTWSWELGASRAGLRWDTWAGLLSQEDEPS